MPKRTKLIDDPSELVVLLRALATPLTKSVLSLLLNKWYTINEIAEELEESKERIEESIQTLRKCALLDVGWRMPAPGEKPEMEYHCIYGKVQMNIRCTMDELAEVLNITFASDCEIMPEIMEIVEHVRKGNKSILNISKDMKISPIRVKSLARRSDELVVKGQRIDLAQERI
jgi:predicted DNA-binding ArsR family transcriptional regulator